MDNNEQPLVQHKGIISSLQSSFSGPQTGLNQTPMGQHEGPPALFVAYVREGEPTVSNCAFIYLDKDIKLFFETNRERSQ